jgi:hypothetical protein
VIAGKCSIQSLEIASVLEYGIECKMIPTYHHIDVFSKDSRVCGIPPRKRAVFQSRHLLSKIGNQFMQIFVAYLPYQHLYSGRLDPLLPKKHCISHKLDDLSHH